MTTPTERTYTPVPGFGVYEHDTDLLTAAQATTRAVLLARVLPNCEWRGGRTAARKLAKAHLAAMVAEWDTMARQNAQEADRREATTAHATHYRVTLWMKHNGHPATEASMTVVPWEHLANTLDAHGVRPADRHDGPGTGAEARFDGGTSWVQWHPVNGDTPTSTHTSPTTAAAHLAADPAYLHRAGNKALILGSATHGAVTVLVCQNNATTYMLREQATWYRVGGPYTDLATALHQAAHQAGRLDAQYRAEAEALNPAPQPGDVNPTTPDPDYTVVPDATPGAGTPHSVVADVVAQLLDEPGGTYTLIDHGVLATIDQVARGGHSPQATSVYLHLDTGERFVITVQRA